MSKTQTTDRTPPSPEESRARLQEILEQHWAVMLFNRSADGKLAGRPMAREKVDADGTMYFATGMDSQKITEMEADPTVTISVQSTAEYAVVSGRAKISQDRALIDSLWKDSWKVWFPEGKDDPSIAIVIVTPEEGTYWDQTKTQGLSFLFRLAKARLTGKEVEIDPGDSQHVSMKGAGA